MASSGAPVLTRTSGGTQAPAPIPRPPSVKATKSQQASRVPGLKGKVVGAAKTYLNKASGKMETPGQMKQYRQRAVQNVKQHGGQKSAGSAASHGPRPESEWNQKEVEQHIGQRVKAEIAAETQPYVTKAQQITNDEAATQQRYRGFTGEAEKANAGLLANQQAGAKTTDNEAAEAVRKAAEPTVTAGNNAATQNGGYVDPAVKAALEEGVASTTGLASAAQGKAITQGQNEENYLRNLNAAATQRYQAGQGQLTEGFGRERRANAAEEAKIAGRAPGAIGRDVEAFNARQANTKLAEQKLKSEGVKLEQGQQKIGNEGKKITAAERNNQRTVAASERNNERTTQTARENNERTTAVAQQHATEKREREEGKGAKPATPEQKNKYTTAMGGAYQTVRTLAQKKVPWDKIREVIANGYYHEEIEGKVVTRHVPKVDNATFVTAAEQAYRYHGLDKSTRAQLGKLNFNIGYDPEAFEAISGEKYTAPKKYTKPPGVKK